MANLSANARRLADVLQQRRLKAVFAESCTGGLIAASLAKVPGISNCFCGSAVTYRTDTKRQWLGVSSEMLTRPGPVSAKVAREMATGVLAITPEAEWSASVTGHLGPNAPRELDALIWIGVAHRSDLQSEPPSVRVTASRHMFGAPTRIRRQQEAAILVIGQLLDAITSWHQVR